MQLGFYFDQNRCSGCNNCIVTCKDYNGVNPGPAHWRRFSATESGVFPDLKIFNLVLSCNHCANPACMAACPAGAIYKRKEDGIVMINRDECQEFKTCAVACPFSGPQFADDAQEPVWQEKWQVKHPMQKCNFCLERWSESKKPICVEGCPQRALDAGDITELIKKYPDALRTVAGFPFSDMDRTGVTLAKDTVPSILFKPKQ